MNHHIFALPLIIATCFSSVAQETTGLTEEIWIGTTNKNIEALIFRKPASSFKTINQNLDIVSHAEDYGARYTTLLSPPETGDYTFWVCGDDYAILSIAPDDKDNQLKLLCKTDKYTPRKNFTLSPSQQSASIPLEKGKQYCLRLLHAQGDGGGHVAAAWQGPGIKGRQIIQAKYLSPFSSPHMDELKHQIQRKTQQKNDLLKRITDMTAEGFQNFRKTATVEEQQLLGEALLEVFGQQHFLKASQSLPTLKKYADIALGITLDPASLETSPISMALLRFQDAYLAALSVDELAAFGAHPKANIFGNIASLEEPSTHTAILTSSPEKTGKELLFTGFYAPPGKVVELSLPAAWVDKGVQAIIGHHRNITKAKSIDAPMASTRSFPIKQKTTKIINPYGGIIYLDIPAKLGGKKVKVTLKNVYACPQFQLGKDTDETWKTLRQSPAPWGEISADNIVLTLPRTTLLTLDNPTELLTFWQHNTALHEEFYNYKPGFPFRLKACHHAIEGISYLPLEIQIKNIQEIINIDRLKANNYALFLHEHGHHADDNRMIFDNSSEATCNWAGYAMKHKIPMDWKFTDIQNIYFLFDPLMKNFQKVRQPGWTTLGGPHAFSAGLSAVMSTYAFDFGWQAIQNVVKRLTTDTDEMYQWAFTSKKQDHQSKLDRWIIGLSQEAKRDVRPFFAQFDLTTSPDADQFLDTLKLKQWNRTDTANLPISGRGAVVLIKNAKDELLNASLSKTFSGTVPAETPKWSINSLLFPDTNAEYTLHFSANGPATLWLSPRDSITSGEIIAKVNQAGEVTTSKVKLKAHQLQYLRANGVAPCTEMKVDWTTPTGSKQEIPHAALIPAYNEAVQSLLIQKNK